jgi:hypothetical protein
MRFQRFAAHSQSESSDFPLRVPQPSDAEFDTCIAEDAAWYIEAAGTWAHAQTLQAEDDLARRLAEDDMFACALRDPNLAWLCNIRALMALGQSVARTRMAAFFALLAAIRKILRGLVRQLLAVRFGQLAMQCVLPAETPSGRAIPSYCLTPRLVAQRPQTARATRAVLMR